MYTGNFLLLETMNLEEDLSINYLHLLKYSFPYFKNKGKFYVIVTTR